jgi:hypothetical protein
MRLVPHEQEEAQVDGEKRHELRMRRWHAVAFAVYFYSKALARFLSYMLLQSEAYVSVFLP